MPDMDLDPDPNNSGRTGPGRVYDEQLPEHPELTALKLFIEAGHYRLNTSITQQFARLSQEIQVLAFAAQNSQGRSTANNASASGVNLAFLSKIVVVVMLTVFNGILGFLKSTRETIRLDVIRGREFRFK